MVVVVVVRRWKERAINVQKSTSKTCGRICAQSNAIYSGQEEFFVRRHKLQFVGYLHLAKKCHDGKEIQANQPPLQHVNNLI